MNTPVEPIIKLVARHYKWNPRDIRGKSRVGPIVKARFMAIWLIREHTKLSWHAIALCMGKKNHTGILYSHQAVSGWMESDSNLRAEAMGLLKRVAAL